MDVKNIIAENYDEEFERALPGELTESYHILECLNSADGCDTLLVLSKSTGKKFVAKCYSRQSPFFDADELNIPEDIPGDAVPHFEGGYANEEYRCVLREYVEGTSLYDYVKSHRLTEEEIADIAVRIAEAMKKLHGMEPPVIHRDIKPQNIIVKDDGSVMLIDLGISRIYKDDGKEDTVLAGTPVFAPPEQYGFMQTDIKSDIYSFGVVLSWMLTGESKPIREPHTALEKISHRCSEFAPEKRFKNDEALIAELTKASPAYQKESRIRKKCLSLSVIALLAGIVIGVLGHMAVSGTNLWGEKYVKFKEPLIEQAARAMLDKPSGQITEKELNYVTGIYISGDIISLSSEEFFEDLSKWYDNGMVYGDISDLSDLELMPNLREVCIGGQHIKDISALKNLELLEMADFHHNDIKDISPLAGKKHLYHIGFNSNKLTSIEAISKCHALTGVDLRNAGTFDGSPVRTLGTLNFIDIACDSDAYDYLGGKQIGELKYGAPGQTDIACIRDVGYVEKLYIGWSEISDISAIEGREDIVSLNMEGCAVDDISPIFSLPNLQKVTVSERNRVMFEDYVKENDTEYDFEVEFAG